MSVVAVQIGQCGNQVGRQLFSTLMEDLTSHGTNKKQDDSYKQECLDRFFTSEDAQGKPHRVPRARAVMVDMEPKVIAEAVYEAKKSGTWEFPPKKQFCLRRGSGNNWAHGYAVHGPQVQENVLEMVRHEVESCDHFGGFLSMLSVAGGTGSGLGTLIMECLREEYPHSFILDQVVWPYSMGEVAVQNYNAILTLSHLYQVTDGILVVANDIVHKICSQLLALDKVSFQNINAVIAHQMAGILQPAQAGLGTGRQITNILGNLLGQTVPHPEYKLLTVQSIPQMSERSKVYSTYQWPGLLKHLRQMLIARAPMEEGIDWSIKAGPQRQFNHSISNLLVLRGSLDGTVDMSAFADACLYPSWVSTDSSFQVWSQPKPLHGYEKCATLLSNSQFHTASLDMMVDRAWKMFAARGYIHHYTRHGLLEEDFVDAFACLEQVITSYKSL